MGLLKDVPIDWAQLLHDVQRWYFESRAIQREWARGFWGTHTTDERLNSDDQS